MLKRPKLEPNSRIGCQRTNPTTKRRMPEDIGDGRRGGCMTREFDIVSVSCRFTKVKLKVMSLIFKTPLKEKF
jgi:hypothetical protein